MQSRRCSTGLQLSSARMQWDSPFPWQAPVGLPRCSFYVDGTTVSAAAARCWPQPQCNGGSIFKQLCQQQPDLRLAQPGPSRSRHAVQVGGSRGACMARHLHWLLALLGVLALAFFVRMAWTRKARVTGPAGRRNGLGVAVPAVVRGAACVSIGCCRRLRTGRGQGSGWGAC